MKKIKNIFYIILIFVFTIVFAESQYYYFSDPSNISFNGYQQGCVELINVRFNTETKEAVGGIFHLILDNSKIDYETGGSLGTNLFVASTLGFSDWVSTFPKRKLSSNYTILETERYNASNPTLAISGDKPYGYLIFRPKYNNFEYSVDFDMFYVSGHNYTTETTLSYNGIDIIDPLQQNINIKKTIDTKQEPCSNDTLPPNIIDNNYINGSTKNINLGLDINLTDSINQGIVPYVWRNGSRTGNIWGINNQFGIDTGSINIKISGNNQFLNLDHTHFNFTSIGPKTRQDKDRDYKITLVSGDLFDFGVEKKINVSYFVKDLVGLEKNIEINFNNPQNPWVTEVYPSNNQTHVTYDSLIRFKIHDDWAGINTGTIVVILSGIGNTFYVQYGYNDLIFTSISGYANYDDYIINIFTHQEFPSLSNIAMYIYGYDFVGNGGQLYSGKFLTKPSCFDLGCCDLVRLSTGYGLNFNNYINSLLYVSGGINPYLYFDGNTGYIDCNLEDTFLSIYKGNGNNSTGVFVGLSSFSELKINGSNVRAILSGNTLFLEKITIIPPGGGGGGGGFISKDNCCVNGGLAGGNELCEDLSDSYYDGTCLGGYHGSADICGVNESKYSDELKGAYLYSYKYGITTMCPIWEADLDGYLYRNHFAKMISEYAVNVLGKIPDIGKEGCDKFVDIKNDTDEMRNFMKTACELNLMGMKPDGKTPMENFHPHDMVTRAEFGTVFSRLLFGERYNIKNESLVYKNDGYWYKDHLMALKNNNIMTKIDGEWPKYLERRGWVMLMMLRADKYGVFAGKIPALMGMKALFE